MGPLLVLVSHCFRENVVISVCSLDNLLQKNVLLFSFSETKFQNAAHLKKKGGGLFLTYFSQFFSYQGKITNFFFKDISHSHAYMCFAHPIEFFLFCLTNFEKNTNYQTWFLFGVIPGVDSYSRHFGTINK